MDKSPLVNNAFRVRLREVMKQRNVSGAALAPLFGVSKMTVSRWLRGEKPIAADAVPLLQRWIESGSPPTEEELAARARGESMMWLIRRDVFGETKYECTLETQREQHLSDEDVIALEEGKTVHTALRGGTDFYLIPKLSQ